MKNHQNKRRSGLFFIIYFFFGFNLMLFIDIEELYAQGSIQEWRISLMPSKVTSDPLDSRRFFNSVTVSVQYNRSLVSNIDWVFGLSFLQTIETDGRQDLDPLDQALDRFHKSFLNLDLGIDLIPFHFSASEIRLGIGSGLRSRMEIRSNFATESNLGVLVKNTFKQSWDYGGLTSLEYSQTIYRNWIFAVKGLLRTYNDGDSILSIGFSIGQKF